MIHLDTNYLIGLLVRGSPRAGEVDGWLPDKLTFRASSCEASATGFHIEADRKGSFFALTSPPVRRKFLSYFSRKGLL
jgi:hypothetical protein